jgi:hypothetical protein
VLDLGNRLGVVLVARQFQQVVGIRETPAEFVEDLDDALQRSPLPPERLCALRVVPDPRVLEFADDLGQPFALRRVVKDTPSGHRCALGGR